MRRRSICLVGAAVLAGAAGCRQTVADFRGLYPITRTDDVVEVLHGTSVADPYRWLEDDHSADTRAWIAAQNALTESHLSRIPQRRRIHDRLTQLWDYERFRTPFKRGEQYFMYRNDGLQNQDVLYVMVHPDATPRVLIDPNTFSEDGTVALSGEAISHDAKHIAYGVSSGGSDWQTWKIRDIASGEDLPDTVEWVKFSGASWTHDGQGFFYSRYDAPRNSDEQLQAQNYFQKLYYHRLGTAQDQDQLIYERPDHKDWGFSGEVSEDGRYLVILVWKGTHPENMIFYKDLSRPESPIIELISEFRAQYLFVGNDDTTLWFLTNDGAPRKRLVALPAGGGPAVEVLPEAAETLEAVEPIGGRFVASYLKDAHSVVRIFERDGTWVRDLELPGFGVAYGFDGRSDDPETFYAFTSFTMPPTIYHYFVDSGDSAVFRRPRVPGLRPEDFETRQVFYHSKDGTRIPMFLTHKKGLDRGVPRPTLLYGYGGFNIAITPRFEVANIVWMEMGGVYAVANVRGGGEYGQAWHDAGRLRNKQNVFDDFIAAAEWLIDNRTTSPAQLAISGRSNGGLLVGACMVQRPDLFGACLPGVGVLDMLRFHKFTIGWAWASDYGSPEDPADFATLRAYSPYHNLQPGAHYPATLITTADHDDRVVPAHSFKFAAALQAAQGGPQPVLIRIETRAGHGAGKPTAMRIAEQADLLAFLAEHLDGGGSPP